MASAIKADSTIKILEDENVSGVYYSKIMDIQRVEDFSLFLSWVGSGFLAELSVEGSNDLGHDKVKKFGTINRSKIELKQNEGTHLYTVSQASYRFIRLKIDTTLGNAVFNIHLNNRSGRS